MSESVVSQLHAWLEAHEQELIADTIAMLKIPSIEGEPAPGAPFGVECRRALDLALEMSAKAGFRTADIDGMVGYAEVGEGERMVMSLGHLDVVPTGPGWKHDPFGAEIDGGYIYARGATDDKSATIASFYAMRAIAAVVPDLGVRLRQVYGCNEESGFRCIERYVETEEIPTFGIAPDSDWPLIHGEKGIANLELEAPIPASSFQLIEFSGGQRPNIVIDSCSAKVRVAPSTRAEVEAKLADAWDRNVTYAWEGDVLGAFATGKAAHGSTPYRGDSAAARMLRFLAEISPLETENFLKSLLDMTHPGGAGLGIAGSDEPSGDLTANLGIAELKNGVLELLVNVRYPVTWTGEQLTRLCEARLEKLGLGITLRVTRDSPSLYFPIDSPMVAALVEAYRAETGDTKQPGTMGGGTYARAIPNTVSVGTSWPGDGHAHETDERIKVEHILRASKIYAHMLYRLAMLARG